MAGSFSRMIGKNSFFSVVLILSSSASSDQTHQQHHQSAATIISSAIYLSGIRQESLNVLIFCVVVPHLVRQHQELSSSSSTDMHK
jgi:hypothetical protein